MDALKQATDHRTAWAVKHAIAAPARYAVARAIRDGKLPRLNGSIQCVDCGAPAEDYDHREYARPLDVQPVCRSCNLRRGPASDVMHLCYHYSPLLAPRQPPRRFLARLAALQTIEATKVSAVLDVEAPSITGESRLDAPQTIDIHILNQEIAMNPMSSGGNRPLADTVLPPAVPLTVGADRERDLQAVRAAKRAADTADLSKNAFDRFNKK
jgi:hypothetical protein